MPVCKLYQNDQRREVDLYYQEENPNGDPTILLLHGLGVTSTSWLYQTPVLKDLGLRIVTPDLPGFGQSTWRSEERWSIDRVANIIAEFLPQLHTGPTYVMGISMGGAVALQLALDFPQLVDRLILVNTFACLRPKRWSEWTYFARRISLLAFRGLPAQAEFIAERMFPDPDQAILREALIEQLLQSDMGAYQRAMLGLGLFNVSRRLREIHQPTLVISGECDSTVPLSIQQRLSTGIPGARCVIIPGAGHAVIADHPDEFNRAMAAFIQPARSQAADESLPVR